MAKQAVRRNGSPAPPETGRVAELTNLVRIVSTEFNFANLKRSLSLPLPQAGNPPKPAVCSAPALRLVSRYFLTRRADARYPVFLFYLPRVVRTT
jgi:hypothetical protein